MKIANINKHHYKQIGMQTDDIQAMLASDIFSYPLYSKKVIFCSIMEASEQMVTACQQVTTEILACYFANVCIAGND